MLNDPKLNALAVELHGQRVGVINRLAGDQHLFAFEEEYLDNPKRPTLSLSFKGESGGLVTAVRPVGRRVPPFFSNLLPEGHLRTYLAERAGVKAEREFFLLAALGADLAGAVTVTPFVADGANLKKRMKDAELTYEHSLGEKALRFSLAGVQLKFSAVQETTGGLTIPAHGVGGSWIVKLPSTKFPAVPENEYVMLELARAVGITVPEARLVPVKEIHGLPEDAGQMEGKALVVRRFDRKGRRRIHMEDFAQIFALFPENKYGQRSYANIAAVLRAEDSEESTHEFVRRLAFSVAIGNGDMHLKNWSLLYPDTIRPVLSPAYDLVSTFVYIPGDKLALSFGGSRSLDGISVDQVRRFADTAHLAVNPVWQTAAETMERATDAWKTLDKKELLPPKMQSAIGRQIQRVAASMLNK